MPGVRSLKNVGGPVMREYAEAKSSGLIEPGIVILTDALYEAGAHPLSSCEGHLAFSNKLGRLIAKLSHKSLFRPFVMFSATEIYARSFHRHYNQAKDIYYCWIIRGHFHPISYELVWMIEPIDARLECGDVDFQLVQKDLKVLAQVAIRAAK